MLGCLVGLVLAAPRALPEIQPSLNAICSRIHGRMGYALIDLTTGQRISYRGDERFPSASTIKTAIAVEAIRQIDAGKLKWTDKRPVPPTADRKEWELSQWSYFLKDGVSLDMDGWVNLMITVSDNLATRVLREWLGVRSINASMLALGLPNTKNLASAPADDAALRRLNGQFGMGMTTPNEMARLLELVYRRKAASPDGCEKLLRILSHQYWDDWIGSTVPVEVRTATKSGAISRSRSDTAIVFGPRPYVLTVYSDALRDQSWEDTNEAHQAILSIARTVWAFMSPGLPGGVSAPYRKRFLPTGGGVE